MKSNGAKASFQGKIFISTAERVMKMAVQNVNVNVLRGTGRRVSNQVYVAIRKRTSKWYLKAC